MASRNRAALTLTYEALAKALSLPGDVMVLGLIPQSSGDAETRRIRFAIEAPYLQPISEGMMLPNIAASEVIDRWQQNRLKITYDRDYEWFNFYIGGEQFRVTPEYLEDIKRGRVG